MMKTSGFNVDWKGAHDPDSSWAACRLMLQTLQAHPSSKILNDNSSISRTTMQLSASSLEWLAWMHAAGLRHLVWVMSRELISRPTTEGVVSVIAVPPSGPCGAVAPACVRRGGGSRCPGSAHSLHQQKNPARPYRRCLPWPYWGR